MPRAAGRYDMTGTYSTPPPSQHADAKATQKYKRGTLTRERACGRNAPREMVDELGQMQQPVDIPASQPAAVLPTRHLARAPTHAIHSQGKLLTAVLDSETRFRDAVAPSVEEMLPDSWLYSMYGTSGLWQAASSKLASRPASKHVRLVVLLPDPTPTEASLRCLTQLASDARVSISIACAPSGYPRLSRQQTTEF
jgi:hypothetical protein